MLIPRSLTCWHLTASLGVFLNTVLRIIQNGTVKLAYVHTGLEFTPLNETYEVLMELFIDIKRATHNLNMKVA